MSRTKTMSNFNAWRFPRVSGDEPDFDLLDLLDETFSPRERG